MIAFLLNVLVFLARSRIRKLRGKLDKEESTPLPLTKKDVEDEHHGNDEHEELQNGTKRRIGDSTSNYVYGAVPMEEAGRLPVHRTLDSVYEG